MTSQTELRDKSNQNERAGQDSTRLFQNLFPICNTIGLDVVQHKFIPGDPFSTFINLRDKLSSLAPGILWGDKQFQEVVKNTLAGSVLVSEQAQTKSIQYLSEYDPTHPDTRSEIQVGADGATITMPNDPACTETSFWLGVDWRHIFNAQHPTPDAKTLTIAAGDPHQDLTLKCHAQQLREHKAASPVLLRVSPRGFTKVTAQLPVYIPNVEGTRVILDMLPEFPGNKRRSAIEQAKNTHIELKAAGRYAIGTMDGGTIGTSFRHAPSGDIHAVIGTCTGMIEKTIWLQNPGEFITIKEAQLDEEHNRADLSDLWRWYVSRDAGIHIETLTAERHGSLYRDPLPSSLQAIAPPHMKAGGIIPSLNGTITIDALESTKFGNSGRNVVLAARSTRIEDEPTQEYIASAVRGDSTDPEKINQITIAQTVHGENGKRYEKIWAFFQPIGPPVDQIANGKVRFHRLEKNIIVVRTNEGANLCGFQIPTEGTIHVPTLGGLINQVLHHRVETAATPASGSAVHIDDAELAEIYARLQSAPAKAEPTASA